MRLLATLLLLLLPGLVRAEALVRVDMPEGRHYLVALPQGVANPPLIVALHGGGGNPAQFARNARLTAPALASGFAVAYPAGTSRGSGRLTWNGLYCCGPAVASGVDDAAFLAAVIEDAARRFGTRDRAFLTGMSNGAIMAQTFAALRPDRVAAVATVAGTMDTRQLSVPRPVPFLHIHGTADDRVPYGGGRGRALRTDFASVESVMAAFLAPQGALATPRTVLDVAADGTRILRTEWGAGSRPPVVLVTVEGGGHVWFGGRRADREGAAHDLAASEEVVGFFAAWR